MVSLSVVTAFAYVGLQSYPHSGQYSSSVREQTMHGTAGGMMHSGYSSYGSYSGYDDYYQHSALNGNGLGRCMNQWGWP